MVLYEGFLFTMVMLGFRCLIRFLETASDSVCTVRYTSLTGEPDPRGILPGTVMGLHILAAVHLILACLYSWNPVMAILEWAMAGGYLMLAIWLRKYKSAMEWDVLEARKQIFVPAENS